MFSTSLSQGVGKRHNGSKQYAAAVADITARSHPRVNRSTGCAYSVVNSGNVIKLEISQSGYRQDATRYAIAGSLTPNGYQSNAALVCDGVEMSWEDAADLLGATPDRLMATVLKFAQSQVYVGCKSGRDRYSSRVGNRRKADTCKSRLSKIKIC
jgi:hypothetical protein